MPRTNKTTTPEPTRAQMTPLQLAAFKLESAQHQLENAERDFRKGMENVGKRLRDEAREADQYLASIDHAEHPTSPGNAAEWLTNSLMFLIPNIHVESIIRDAYRLERARARVKDAQEAYDTLKASYDAISAAHDEIQAQVDSCK